MEIFVVLIILFIFLLSIYKIKGKYNPLTAFTGLFLFIAILSSLRLYGIEAISNKTSLVLVIGVISFSIGYLLLSIWEKIKTNNLMKKKTTKKILKINYTFVYILSITTFLFLVFLYIKVVNLISIGYNISQIRSDFANLVTPDLFTNYFHQYVVSPIVVLLPTLVAADYFFGRRDIKLLLLSVLCLILYALNDGGRAVLISLIISFGYSYFIFQSKKTKAQKKSFARNILIPLMVIPVVIFFFTFLSTERGITDGVFKSIYKYYAVSIQHLDYRIHAIDQTENFTYGFAFIRGYWAPIRAMAKYIGFGGLESWYIKVIEYTSVENVVSLGEFYYNAFVTLFYYFYVDFRLLGVIIGSFLYGFLSRHIFSKVENLPSVFNVTLYLLLIYGIMFSMVRWQFYSYRYALSFIYLFLVIKRTNISLKING